jgi:monoamine oxidase
MLRTAITSLVLSVLLMAARGLATKATKAMKTVGICGCGVAGSVAANALARKGYEVHVFEAGRGPGGRASSRVYDQYSFDHGKIP